MSIPIRAADRCLIGTSLNQYRPAPWYLRRGTTTEEDITHCPTGVHHRTVTKHEILMPSGRCIGREVHHERGGVYCEVDRHGDCKWFVRQDVYCKEHGAWHYST